MAVGAAVGVNRNVAVDVGTGVGASSSFEHETVNTASKPAAHKMAISLEAAFECCKIYP